METGHGDGHPLEGIAFRALAKLSVGIVITLEGDVVYCNEAFASMTGLDRKAVAGGLHPFLGGPFVSDATAGRLAAYLKSPDPATPARIGYVRADGLPAWNEVQLCREGEHLIWMHRDITQQVGTHELWQRYEFLLDTSPQFMALVNREHAYELVNRAFAEAFATTPTEISGTGAATVWGRTMYAAVVAPHLAACFRGEEVQVKHWVDLPSGGRRCLDMIYTPYKDGEGTVIHAVFVAWDVTREILATDAVQTANRQLELRVADRTAELQDTLQELEAFNYTIAHDLRSPLRFLKSFTQMLEDAPGTALDDSGRHVVAMIAQGVAEMQHMIDRLLDFSRLSRKPLCLECCDLGRVVRDARRSLADPETAVEIEPLPPCQGDPPLLKQVFVNLLQNAEKFSREGVPPEIAVFPVPAGAGMVRLCVRDNGIGFNMTHAEALFAPFKQLHDHPNDQGSGLGLAIVRRIVERHGGRVWAESDGEEGARFYVELRSVEAADGAGAGCEEGGDSAPRELK